MNAHHMADTIEARLEEEAESSAIWIENRKAEIIEDCMSRAPLKTTEGYSLTEAIREEIDDLDLDLCLLMTARDDSLILLRHEQAKERLRTALEAYALRNAEFEANNIGRENAA